MKSIELLRQRRFLPFFLVQFSFAFNDNIFKNLLVLLLAFKATSEADSSYVSSLASALLIMPFFLFSPLAGQIADKYDKAKIIRIIKAVEILIMSIGVAGFWLESSPILFATLFLLGTHSAFFGPAKFSILPQTFDDHELLSANALVELGTFLAILLGTICGGLLSNAPMTYASVTLIGLSLLGFYVSKFIPPSPASDPGLKLNINPISELSDLYRVSRSPRSIFQSILGISWFWFIGSAIMIQLPTFTQYVLHADKEVVTLLLAVFCLSLGVGSFLCEKLSGDEIEIGLVPFGAAGLSLFFFDLALQNIPAFATPVGIRGYLADPNPIYWRVLIDFFGMGFSGAFFIIPLNSFLQNRANPQVCSRVISANNIFNAIFMVIASVFVSYLVHLKFTSSHIFLILGLINIATSIYIFSVIPDFTIRFIVWILAVTTYRIRYAGQSKIPRHGPIIIVSNHVSYIDWFILAAAVRRPIRFVMYYKFFEAPIVNWICRAVNCIPIASAKEDAVIKKRAFELINDELQDDNVIAIFPEGTLTYDGEMLPFKPGIEEIQKNFQATIVPVVLVGLWGSFFSRSGGKALAKVPKPKRRIVRVVIGEPINRFVSAEELHTIISAMRREHED